MGNVEADERQIRNARIKHLLCRFGIGVDIELGIWSDVARHVIRPAHNDHAFQPLCQRRLDIERDREIRQWPGANQGQLARSLAGELYDRRWTLEWVSSRELEAKSALPKPVAPWTCAASTCAFTSGRLAPRCTGTSLAPTQSSTVSVFAVVSSALTLPASVETETISAIDQKRRGRERVVYTSVDVEQEQDPMPVHEWDSKEMPCRRLASASIQGATGRVSVICDSVTTSTKYGRPSASARSRAGRRSSGSVT